VMSAEPIDRSSTAIIGRPNISKERRLQPFTAVDLERMGSDSWFEIVQGQLYETWPLGFDTAVAMSKLNRSLSNHVRKQRLGLVVVGAGFVMERDPDTVTAPKGAFISSDRLSDDNAPDGYFPGEPDLAIETASPLDTLVDLERKRNVYMRLPVRLLWWIYSERHTASVHVPGKPDRHLSDSDFLDGESIVPGFSIRIAELFDY